MGLEPGFHLVFVHRGNLVVVGEFLEFLLVPVGVDGMILRTVVLILVFDPGGITPFPTGRPHKVGPDAGGERLGGGGLVYNAHLAVLIGQAAVVSGFGFPLSFQLGAPAELFRLVVQLESPVYQAVDHGLVVVDFASFHSAQSGLQIGAAGPLRMQRDPAEQQEESDDKQFTSHL